MNFPRRHFARARVRHIAGQMNRTEAAYSELLEARRRAGEILLWKFERVTLLVASPQEAKGCRLTPDFFVVNKDHEVEFHDTKGVIEEDAWVKFKAASEQFPFRFCIVQKVPEKKGGGWKYTEV